MRLLDIISKKKKEEVKYCEKCADKPKLEFMHERPYSKIKVYYCNKCETKFEFGEIKEQKDEPSRIKFGTALVIVDNTNDAYKLFFFVFNACKRWKYDLICIDASGSSKFKDKFKDSWIRYKDFAPQELRPRIEDVIKELDVDIVVLPRIRSVRSEKSIFTKELFTQLYHNTTYDTLLVDIIY